MSICVIVGVGEGMGMAIARRFAREGFDLALLARRPEKLDAFIEELQPNVTAQAFPADSSDPNSVAAAFDGIRQDMGDPTVLVYNAFIIRSQPLATVPLDQLREEFQVNFWAALQCAQYSLQVAAWRSIQMQNMRHWHLPKLPCAM